MKKLLNHKLNKDISFDKDRHVYSYKGEIFDGITKWISSYCQPFDQKRMAKTVAYKEGKTVQEVLDLWKSLNEYGNEVHDIIEYYINDNKPSDRVELELFKQCCKEIGIKPIAGEFVIYDTNIKKASPIDIVGLKNGKIVVVDLKTMFKPIRFSAYKNAKMIYPLNSLPDSAYYKYCLQTSMYQRWLSEIYKVPVDDTAYIFHIHEDTYDIIPCINLNKQIDLMYEDYRRNNIG